MITIDIRHNFPQVMAKLAELPDKVGNKVLVRALNGAVTQAKPEMARAISREFRVSSSEAKDRLEVRRASAKGGVYRFEAELSASNKNGRRSMNLIAFVEKMVTLAQARKRVKAGEGGTYKLQGRETRKELQLRFQVKRSGGVKIIKGAFIANQGRTMFIRVGKKRLPIKALNTIAMGQMFNTKRLNEVVVKSMLTNFDKHFERELRSVLGGWVK